MIELLLPCGFDTLEYSWVKATVDIFTLVDYSVAKKRQHRPMFRLTKRINETIPCGPYYLIELFVKFLPHLGWLKGGTFRLCLSYLAAF
jgi:hypothetical protein